MSVRENKVTLAGNAMSMSGCLSRIGFANYIRADLKINKILGGRRLKLVTETMEEETVSAPILRPGDTLSRLYT